MSDALPLPSALTADLYELTMAAGYWRDRRTETAVFELFVRQLPPNRSYLVACGTQEAADYLQRLQFQPGELSYLSSLPAFEHTPAGFFEALGDLRFSGDLDALDEGAVLFPYEPILRVSAPIIEAQLVETALLSLIGYPTSVASKAARVTRAAAGRDVVEFGARRAPGAAAAAHAARASYLTGCEGTSNVEAGRLYGIPVYGTMAHSWVMSFAREADAFLSYAHAFPGRAVLLLDTYDTLEAARAVTEVFHPGEIAAVRLDSGDIAALSTQVRAILDASGFHTTRIMASGDLDERSIADLLARGAPLDMFGVGTALTAVPDAPALGVVYKLVETTSDAGRRYTIKLSEEKSTEPGAKQIWRTRGPDGRFAHDLIALADEPAPSADAEPLLKPVLRGGRRVAPAPSLEAARRYASEQSAGLPDDLRSLDPPLQPYAVTTSAGLRSARQQALIPAHHSHGSIGR